MWELEKRYVLPEEIDDGILPVRFINRAWALLSVGLCSLLLAGFIYGGLTALQSILLIPIAVLLGRMTAVDLCHFLLLNIYTIPLLILGLIYAPLILEVTIIESILGILVAASIGVVIDLILKALHKGEGDLGFGDVKMLAVLGAWVGLPALPFALAIAFMSNLVLSLVIPRGQAIPFGFGLSIGLWVMVTLQQPLMDMIFFILG